MTLYDNPHWIFIYIKTLNANKKTNKESKTLLKQIEGESFHATELTTFPLSIP